MRDGARATVESYSVNILPPPPQAPAKSTAAPPSGVWTHEIYNCTIMWCLDKPVLARAPAHTYTRMQSRYKQIFSFASVGPCPLSRQLNARVLLLVQLALSLLPVQSAPSQYMEWFPGSLPSPTFSLA